MVLNEFEKAREDLEKVNVDGIISCFILSVSCSH